jgi:hypothetical protein
MTSTLLDPLKTVLVADFGRTSTRGYVLEQIDGAFRFIAKAEKPIAPGLPFARLKAGWSEVIDDLSWMTGRRVGDSPAANGDGAEALLCVSTLAPPARVLVLESGVNASAGPIVEMLQRVHAVLLQLSAPTGRKDGGWLAASQASVSEFEPEMIVFIGGGPNDALQRANQLVKFCRSLNGLARAVVIADGPAQDQAAAAFEGLRIRKISPAARDANEIAAEIERELVDALRSHPDANNLKSVAGDSAGAVITRADAVDIANRFHASSVDRRVLSAAIDEGAHVHWASRGQSAMVSLPDLDLASAITGFTDQEVRDAINWLPFEAEADELFAWVLNRSIRPATVADNARDRSIEQALARQIIRRALGEMQRSRPTALSDIDLIVGSAKFAEWGQPGAAALTLLDCINQLPNNGVVDLALDRDDLMVAAGALCTLDAGLAASIIENDVLSHLGSAVIIGGATQSGDLAGRGEIRYETGERLQFSVASGAIELLPLGAGESASLILRPERNYSIGGRPSGETAQLTGERRVVGGAVGVILDARERPLLAGGPGRAAKMKQWLDVVNGQRFSSIRRAA